MSEPEDPVLQLLRNIREDISGLDRKLDKQGDELRAEFRSDMHALRANVASDLMTMEKRLNDQIVGLRGSVMEYHSSAVGHGMLLSEFEERLRCVEQRLDTVPPESH